MHYRLLLCIMAASIWVSAPAETQHGSSLSDQLHSATLTPLIKRVLPSVVNLTIKRRPGDGESVIPPSSPEQQQVRTAGNGFKLLDGAEFDVVRFFQPVKGAEVVAVRADSTAWKGGLRQGDIIRTVNAEPVEGPAELASKARNAADNLLINVIRDGSGMFLVLHR